ncbi:MAG: hypothetical protein CL960_02735 [Euryarchaeota archaeon]|jgi:uncharacterized membrane protein YidH (DUF202 family)|nr:hypothetical protein [Euryarchaeota archaeon]MDP6363503.1 hypothetical protein [Candidatus Poseidoniia archaeon]MDP6659070.1 hypothetical protein [Candidatus Poseidoniia archaeon]MDP7006754.1 hypothetical protein [Candidatus Poseidoniia archaeon]|tara:strand:- start:173 stop:457 length:285 start_codon:yes stop_codon:yes gene_type:complete
MQDPYPAGRPFPPPVVALSALAAGFALEHYQPAPLGLGLAGFAAGALIVGGSVLLAMWAVLTFRRAGISVDFRRDTLQLVVATAAGSSRRARRW